MNVRTGDRLKIVFVNIDILDPAQKFFFILHVTDKYSGKQMNFAILEDDSIACSCQGRWGLAALQPPGISFVMSLCDDTQWTP